MLITVSKSPGKDTAVCRRRWIPFRRSKQAVTIRIKPGIYEEKITIVREAPPILLLGRTRIPP